MENLRTADNPNSLTSIKESKVCTVVDYGFLCQRDMSSGAGGGDDNAEIKVVLHKYFREGTTSSQASPGTNITAGRY